jgi:hypothetical protein
MMGRDGSSPPIRIDCVAEKCNTQRSEVIWKNSSPCPLSAVLLRYPEKIIIYHNNSIKTISGKGVETRMADNLKVKAGKALDDARVAAHAVLDDVSTAAHNTLVDTEADVQKVSEEVKIGVHKAVADAKIAAHKAETKLKKK